MRASTVAWCRWAAAVVCLAVLAGCTPPGQRALLEGKRLLERGKYPEAVEKLQTATSLLATNAQAWNYLGLACHHAGQAAAAEKAYQRALLLNHDLTEAHYNLGCLMLAQNKLENARAEFTAYALRRGNSVEGFLKLGVVQLRAREAGAAEKTFNDALRLSPDNAEAWNGLGMARLHRGRAGEAAQCFLSALKHQPGYAPAVLNLAIVAQQYFGDRPHALERYREYLALKPVPENADAVRTLVRQLENESNPLSRPVTTVAAEQEPKPAADSSNQTSARNLAAPAPASSGPAGSAPQKPARRSLLQRLFGSESNTAAPAPALATAAPVRAAPPTNTAIARYSYQSPAKPAPGNRAAAQRAFTQGVQAQQSGKLSDAIQAYHKAAHLDPAFFEAYYNLGLAAAAAANPPLALSAYENALALKPDSFDARYNFALALQRSKYFIDAANEFEKVLGPSPNDARAHLALGNLYAQELHQPAAARPHYLKVLELEPQNPQAPQLRRWLDANQ